MQMEMQEWFIKLKAFCIFVTVVLLSIVQRKRAKSVCPLNLFEK
jgi:hypothetical protein